MQKIFSVKDYLKFGQEAIMTYDELIRSFEYEEDYDGVILEHWAHDAEVEDEFVNHTLNIKRIE